MSDEIRLNSTALNVMLDDARDDGYKSGIVNVLTILRSCTFVESGATISGEDIASYLENKIKEQ